MKTIRNMILFITSSIVFGYLLMSMVYALPLDWSGERYDATIRNLKAAGMYPKDPVSNRQLDNYADSVSMLLASYQGNESPWRKAAINYYMSYDGKDVYHSAVTPYDYLIGNYDVKKAHPGTASYARYWHGNLLLFKPLMRSFSYPQIRRVNFALVMLLTGMAAFLIFKRLPRMLMPFILVMLCIAPTTIGRTLEFACVIHVMLLIVIDLLGFPSFFKKLRVRYLFLVAGIFTAYVDFLTAPTITLIIPLVLLCQLRHGEKGLMRLAIDCILFWGCGYIGMWCGKWIIALLAEGQSFFNSLTEAVQLRVSTNSHVSRFGALIRCFREVFSTSYINIAFVLLVFLTIVRNFRYRKTIVLSEALKQNMVFLLPILITAVWYFVLAEHSWRHYWFAYRTGTGAVFAFMAALDCCDPSSGNFSIYRRS